MLWEISKKNVFTSKDDYITKTQIQYLESELCRIANESGNVILDNGNRSSKPNLSEVDDAEMKQFLEAIKLILSSIGIDVLESKKVVDSTDEKKAQEIIYEFSIKGAKARMKIEDDKYIVLKGSTVVVKNRSSASNAIIIMRNSLIEDGVIKLINQNNFYQFEEDFIFKSPSYAAAAISGEEENGRKQWGYIGKNLNQVETEEIE